MKVWISFHPLSVPTTAARFCRVSTPTRGVWRALLETALCHYWQCYINFLSLHMTWSWMLKEIYRWVIENTVVSVWCFEKACDCLLAPLLTGIDCQWHSKKLYSPNIPTCLEGDSTVWAVKSEMWMTSWDRAQNEGCQSSDGERQTLQMQHQAWFTERAGIVVFGACTLFRTGKWFGNQNNNVFVRFCTASLCYCTYRC